MCRRGFWRARRFPLFPPTIPTDADCRCPLILIIVTKELTERHCLLPLLSPTMTASTDSLLKSFHKTLHAKLWEEEKMEALLELFNGEHGVALAKARHSSGQYPLHQLLNYRAFPFPNGYKLVSKILSLYPDVLLKEDIRGNRPLHFKWAQWDKTLVELFYKVLPECISTPNSKGQLPIHRQAAEPFLGKEGKQVASLLLELYPEGIRQRDKNGNFPIDVAVGANQDLVEMLLDRYQEPIDICDDDGTYLLHVACTTIYGSNPDAVLCLLKARPEHASKQESSTKMLPLHYAC